MWKNLDTDSFEVPAEADFDIWVAKGPMKGLHRECSIFEGDWYNRDDLIAPGSWVTHVRLVSKPVGPHDKIAGRTLNEWFELAQRDDCFAQMVPSDLRAILMFIA